MKITKDNEIIIDRNLLAGRVIDKHKTRHGTAYHVVSFDSGREEVVYGRSMVEYFIRLEREVACRG